MKSLENLQALLVEHANAFDKVSRSGKRDDKKLMPDQHQEAKELALALSTAADTVKEYQINQERRG